MDLNRNPEVSAVGDPIYAVVNKARGGKDAAKYSYIGLVDPSKNSDLLVFDNVDSNHINNNQSSKLLNFGGSNLKTTSHIQSTPCLSVGESGASGEYYSKVCE